MIYLKQSTQWVNIYKMKIQLIGYLMDWGKAKVENYWPVEPKN